MANKLTEDDLGGTPIVEPVVAGGGAGSGEAPSQSNVQSDAKGVLTPDANGEIKVESITVAGVMRDAAGNTWTIPEEDTTELLYKSPFDIKKEKDFYYQFEHKDNVPQMMTEGFKPVTRKEIGLQGFTPVGEYGVNVDSVYQIHDLVCLKIPSVLNERRLKALGRVCDAAVAQTQPPKDGVDNSGPTVATLKATIRTKEAAEAAERMRVAPMARYDQKHEVIKVRPRDESKDVVK